jgi:hypothetical protein
MDALTAGAVSTAHPRVARVTGFRAIGGRVGRTQIPILMNERRAPNAESRAKVSDRAKRR